MVKMCFDDLLLLQIFLLNKKEYFPRDLRRLEKYV